MSSNRLMYDTCAYKIRLQDSTTPLAYHINPMKYENCQKCRSELGLLGGPEVSQIKGNLVDLENELRGQTRLNSQCPTTRYHPDNKLYTKETDLNKAEEINTDLLHLPSCQMVRYKPIPLPDPIVIEHCPAPSLTAQASCNTTHPGQCNRN